MEDNLEKFLAYLNSEVFENFVNSYAPFVGVDSNDLVDLVKNNTYLVSNLSEVLRPFKESSYLKGIIYSDFENFDELFSKLEERDAISLGKSCRKDLSLILLEKDYLKSGFVELLGIYVHELTHFLRKLSTKYDLFNYGDGASLIVEEAIAEYSSYLFMYDFLIGNLKEGGAPLDEEVKYIVTKCVLENIRTYAELIFDGKFSDIEALSVLGYYIGSELFLQHMENDRFNYLIRFLKNEGLLTLSNLDDKIDFIRSESMKNWFEISLL